MSSCFVRCPSMRRKQAHNCDRRSASLFTQYHGQCTHTTAECVPSSLPFEGEWIGQSASFGSRGDALPVPETYVPGEYASWGIEIRDWATVSSMKATGERSPELLLLTKFMLPTVGCEADAASFVDDKRFYVSGDANSAQGSHDCPSGRLVLSSTQQNFVGHPGQLPASGKAVLDFSVLQNSKTRRHVRINLNKWSDTAQWSLQKIDLFRDQYSGEYTGGRELPMSCGAEPGFSSATVPPEQAQQASSAVSYSQELFESTWCWEASADDGVSVVHLPLGTSVRVEVSEDRVDVQVVVLPEGSQEPGEKQTAEATGGPVLARVVYECDLLVEAAIEQVPGAVKASPSST